jgi:RNA polymerase sigma-70 factor (ECF subfamily)
MMTGRITRAEAEWLHDVYRRHRISVLRLAKARLGTSVGAEDIVSETFVRAAQHVRQLREFGENVLPWLFRVAGNLIRDHQKSAYVSRRVAVDELPDRPAAQFLPEPELFRSWLAAVVGRGVEQLTLVQRQCLALRFVEELSVADSARLMDRSPTALRQLQHRAVLKLGALLGDTGEDLREVA